MAHASKETARAYYRSWRARNKEKIRAYKKKSNWRPGPESKEKTAARMRIWHATNRIRVNAYRRNRPHDFKLRDILRRRINHALKSESPKSSSTEVLLGCSLQQLKTHLESLWKPGMSWENHSPSGWHIDHKKPCALFDLSKHEDRLRCFHYSNLQPLWAKENMRKSDSFLE